MQSTVERMAPPPRGKTISPRRLRARFSKRQKFDHRVFRIRARILELRRTNIVKVDARAHSSCADAAVATISPDEAVGDEGEAFLGRIHAKSPSLATASCRQAEMTSRSSPGIARHQPQWFVIRERGHALLLHPFDQRTARLQLFFETFKAAVKVIDAIDHGLAFRRQPR
ncbi:MAG: hypothetical protein R3C58_08295 [Parvularculaceae bacterium]